MYSIFFSLIELLQVIYSLVGEMENSFGPLAAGCKDTLLAKMADICAPKEMNKNKTTSEYSPLKLSAHASDVRLSDKSGFSSENKQLIQEISTENNHCNQARVPEYTLEVREGACPCTLINISLPEVISVQQCTLEISQVINVVDRGISKRKGGDIMFSFFLLTTLA